MTNTQGIFCGHSETELTERGRGQAEALARRLADEPIAAVYTSGLGRAVATAHIALAGRDVPFFAVADLRELNYGEWEMQKGGSVARKYPEQHRLMRAEDPAWQPPGGENIGMVRARTFAALKRIARAQRHQTVLVVSHGTAIQCMLSEMLAMAPTHTFRIDIANCGLSVVEEVRSNLTLMSLNETAYLDVPAAAKTTSASGEAPG